MHYRSKHFIYRFIGKPHFQVKSDFTPGIEIYLTMNLMTWTIFHFFLFSVGIRKYRLGNDTYLELSLGDYVKIPCGMYSSTFWTFSNGAFPLNIIIDQEEGNNESTLSIYNALTANEGVYSCHVDKKLFITTKCKIFN